LTIAFGLRGNPFEREVPLCVYYKAQMLASTFRADLLYLGAIIVELKASKRLGAADEAQILHYVKAAQRELGLLLNFGAERLEIRRFIGAPNTQDSSGALER
jgi:GxxExxY protein